jgi:hypothetical protein
VTYPLSPYVWPGRYLLRPSYDRTLTYLDLNHWIALARAGVGHREGGRHVAALERIRRAKAVGRAIFPLSSTHYMEMAGIKQARQRRDVAAVMEELSGFTTIVSRAVIMELEIEAVLDEMIGLREQPYRPLPLLGSGIGRSMGLVGGLRIRDASGADKTDEMRATWKDGPEAFDRKMMEMNLHFEREMLRGPADEQVEQLRADGWDPDVARRIAGERAAAEQAQAANLDTDPRWRRGRLRDVVSARHLLIDLNTPTTKALAARGVSTTTDFLTDRHVARRFVDSMPSSDVYVTLVTAAPRNPQRRWTANDVFDIDAASTAVAYCDIVVCDSHVSNALRAAKLEERAQVVVLDNLNDLGEHLEARAARRGG